MKVPILGIMENMSYLTCPHCASASTCLATAEAGARRTKCRSTLGELPLDPEVRIGGDSGEPIVRRKGKGEPFLELARNAMARLEEAAKVEGPKIEISD